ncbi:uncharacterized protein LOC112594039 [Melanaphis sacchari]|uniref:uncharacterized protein LOC112594039 n=1 Tax=Melanaphis sacchari TaxID=742174 RepID=UPI000DC13A9A|nr:uncharacterized protein LOC112594039 [Melanaphis sacchari]
MIIQSIFIQTTFWWSLSTIVGCIPMEQASDRRITVDSVPLPDIPMASEESVHMLTAVRFPPPALFFANPDKKWSLGDFEKADQVTTYSVTDDLTETQDQQDAYLQQDPVTTVEPETEAEVETTTIATAVDGLVDELKQTASDGHVEGLQPTVDEHVESLRPTDDGHAENHQLTDDGLVESLQPASDRLADSRPTSADRLIVTPKQQQLPVRIVNQRPANRWSEKRWTASRDRLRRPAASEHNRSQFRTIVLTSRPLPVPGADVRFPEVEYAVASLGDRKNLHDFHQQ